MKSTSSESQPIREIYLSEIKSNLTFETPPLPKGYENTKVYLVGDFNNFGKVEGQDGTERPMTEEEMEDYAFTKEENRYLPPKSLQKIEPGTTFKLLVIPPEVVPKTSYEVLKEHSIYDLYSSVSQKRGEDPRYMARLEEGIRALLRMEGLPGVKDLKKEELIANIKELTLEDFRKYWNYKSHRWELGELSPPESELFVFAEGKLYDELFEMTGEDQGEEYKNLKAIPKESEDEKMLEILGNAGIAVSGIEEGSFTAPNGKRYSRNRYWMINTALENRSGAFGDENVFPKI